MPDGHAVGYRISSTRTNPMFGRAPGFGAPAAALSNTPRLASMPPAATAPVRCRNSRRSMSLLIVAPIARISRHEVLEDAHQLEDSREPAHLSRTGDRAAEALVLVARHPELEVHSHGAR